MKIFLKTPEGDTNSEEAMDQLTAQDVLTLVEDRALRISGRRENGESDMWDILITTQGIKTMLDKGKTRAEILAYIAEDQDESKSVIASS